MRLLLTCFIGLIAQLSAHAQVIILDSEAGLQVDSGFHYLKDITKTLQLTDVIKVNPSEFITSEPVFKEGLHVYWLHFFLKNPTTFDREWIVDFQNWSYVTAYVRETSQFHIHRTGHLYPYSKRDYPIANKAYILLPIKASQTSECFVRLESRYNNDLKPDSLAFTITPRHIIDKKNTQDGKLIAAFLAVFGIMFLYNFFIYISTRLQTYALYLLIILLGFYHTAYNSGYLIQFFGAIDSFPVVVTHFEKFSSIMLGATLTLFASAFLKVKDRYPIWYKGIQLILGAYLVTALIIVIHEPSGLIPSIIVASATIFIIITLGIKSTIDHYPSAAYFLIGSTAFCLSGVVIILCYSERLKSIFPMHGFLFTYALPIGSTIEMAFFSFALANLINVLRKANFESLQQQSRLVQEQEELKLRFQQELFKTQRETQEETLVQVSEELHDNIGQLLSTTKMLIGITERNLKEIPDTLRTANQTLSKAIQDLRMLSKSLNKEWLSQFNIIQNLHAEADRINMAQSIHIQISSTVTNLYLTAEFQVILFRIIQEAVQNIIKHAKAERVSITITQDKIIEISIVDDGKGFDFQTHERSGIGIINMKHRAQLLGGTIQWNSELGQGTVVSIQLPFQ